MSLTNANKPEDNAAASIGNASNPLAEETNNLTGNNQLLHKKAETYLREAGNIEDMPDDNDAQKMDGQLKKEK